MIRLITGLALALCLVAAPVAAADMKIAYIDLQKALNLSTAGKTAKERISVKVKEYEGTVQVRQDELKKLKEELEKQALLLSAEARAEKERDYQQKVKEFQRFTKDIQEELQQTDADYTRKILEQVLGVVQKYGEAQGYTMILEKTESSIIYADKTIDITNEIIKQFDSQNK